LGAESHKDLLRALGAAVALLAFAALAACGAGSGPQPAGEPGARGGTDTRTASEASDIFFPQVREGLDGGPDALAGGILFVDENGCLRLEPGKGPTWVPVWPASTLLETEDGRSRIKSSGGRTVAEVGKEVSMGGGQIGLPKDVVSPRTARELRDHCPGDYWIAVNPSLGPGPTPVGSVTPDG
jgi:hypothetical protein